MTTLLSVNVGMPKDVSWQGKTVHTGIYKQPVAGRRMVRRLNIDGDGQGDLGGHGGEMRAVLVYQLESYLHWQEHFGRELAFGQFGENLTVDGLADDEVCIGDRYRIGEAEFEVTQPRVTCYRVGMRMGEPRLPALLVSHHRPGFYLRVITEGHIEAGDRIVKTRTGPQALTVADTDALLYLPHRDPVKLRAAVRIPAMSPGWQQSFRDLLAETPAAGPAWPGFRPLRVTKVVRETATVSSLYLSSVDEQPLPAARPGQYVTVRLPDAVRSYSLSSAPGADAYRISVKREGKASAYLTGSVGPGTVLETAAPRGEFVLSGDTGPVLLISVGIGVTPVLAMLHALSASGADREVWWLHGARSPAEHALAAEAHELLTAMPNAREHIFSGGAGRLTVEKLTALNLPTDASAYICGPEGFMADMREALTALGIDRVHSELFGALPSINPGLTRQTVRPPHPGPPGTGPRVTFARSGVTTPFTGDSLLELADACDVPARWSCRTGVCQTCVTPLLAGEVTYSPDPLEPPPDGQVLICCARPRADVVLDM
jgi:ferredoxin-NADP reductase/MOSC domain-containing protein YiiM